MLRQKGKRKGCWTQKVSATVIALVVELMVVVVFGIVASWLAARGWLQLEQLQSWGIAALIVAGLIGGAIVCLKEKRMPLLWGMGVGALLSLVCMVAGLIMCGWEIRFGFRLLAPVVGGAFAGILTALRK